MRSIFILLFLIILNVPVFATESIYCPAKTLEIIEKESIFNKITGVNFFSKKIAEAIIEKELGQEFKSNFDVNLQIYTVDRLKKGEFKSIEIKAPILRYKALSMSDFYAETICSYNNVIYKKSRIYYPIDLPFKYKGKITNFDILSTINSKEFQKEIINNPLKLSGINLFQIKTPKVELKDNRVFFEIPVQTVFGSTKIKFNADIEVKNNKVVLKDITFNSKSNIISSNMLVPILNQINPIAYDTSIDSKYCKLYITDAKIETNKILTNGIFIIKKNYEGNE